MGAARRINAESAWWTDPRRFELAERVGSEVLADGIALNAWKLSQDFWANDRKKIPVPVFMKLPYAQDLIAVKLATKHGKFIYVRGSRQFHAWLIAARDNGRKGGKPKVKNITPRQPNANHLQSETITSSSSSSSSSSSKEKEGEVCERKRSHKALPKLAKIWNQHRGKLPEVKSCGNERIRKAETRWRENPSEEFWTEIVKRLSQSRFCLGQNKSSWRADFDFLICPETANKTIEGKYDDRREQQEPRRIRSPEELQIELAGDLGNA